MIEEVGQSASFPPKTPFLFESNDTCYSVHCCLNDTLRRSEYQRLRADTFVRQMKWNIPLDAEGRERDRYDAIIDIVNTHCVYGRGADREHLLAGVRVFQLHNWTDSMVMNEFASVGMIPSWLQRLLRSANCTEFLELTRFCVQRGRWYSAEHIRFNNQIARDLTYSAVYAQAQSTGRHKALALVDSNYLRVISRSHFDFQILYTQQTYSLIIIHLWRTIDSIKSAGDHARVQRMLALCNERKCF